MDEKWDNIFLYQHGGEDTARQLENNTTKNLLKVAQDTDKRFVSWLVSTGFPEAEWGEYELEHVETQVSLRGDDVTDALDEGAEGYLLGISRYGERVATDADPNPNARSTIDGWLEFEGPEGRRLVGIEVKTYSDKLQPGQMSKYRHHLQIPRDPDSACLGTLTWGQIYSAANKATREGRASKQRRELGKDAYLWDEFARSLLYDQLEIIVAENEGTPNKRIWMRPDPSATESEEKFEATVTWEDSDNVTKSRLGWIAAEALEDLLSQLPQSVREAAFREPVSYSRFLEALYAVDEYAHIENKKDDNIARIELSDGSDRAFRMKWITDDETGEIVSEVPHFRIVKYYESGRYTQGASPNLDPRAFETLFGSIQPGLRRRALIEDPDFSELWRTTVEDSTVFRDPRASE
jgi:hypothetical protein